MDMNLSKYLAFVTAAEYGSITKAAEVLRYSQSAVSRMIGDLEAEWSVVLFERGKGGVRLTSDGLKLFPHAQNLCAEYRLLQAEAEAVLGLQSGIIRIGVFSSVATHWMPNIIRAFQKDFPNIDYELLLGDYKEIEEWIASGRVDCGFVRLPAESDLDTIFLEQDRSMVVLPENHYLCRKEKISATDLCVDPFLLLEKSGKSMAREVFEKSGLTPNIRFTTWDDYAIMSMVEGGLGISILPELILRRIPYKVAIKELESPIYRSIGLAVRSKKSMSLAVQKFIEYLPFR